MPTDWNERGAISNDVLASIVRTFHCLAAEPAETILRIVVRDAGKEVAYETTLLITLRQGYRVFLLRSRLGTRIELCYLLARITIADAPNLWADAEKLRIASVQMQSELQALRSERDSLRSELSGRGRSCSASSASGLSHKSSSVGELSHKSRIMWSDQIEASSRSGMSISGFKTSMKSLFGGTTEERQNGAATTIQSFSRGRSGRRRANRRKNPPPLARGFSAVGAVLLEAEQRQSERGSSPRRHLPFSSEESI